MAFVWFGGFVRSFGRGIKQLRDAYKFFETLSARGVCLSATDLLKNYLFSVLHREGQHEHEMNSLERILPRQFSAGLGLTNHPYSHIYCFVKTTIDLPDELLHRAKITAAQRKTTLRALVVSGLEAVTSGVGDNAKEKERKKTFKRLLKAMQASNTLPMVPLPRKEIQPL